MIHLNVPELRFPEFSGEWEEKKLVDIAKFSKGKGISKKDISEEGIPCIRYGELYTTYKEKISDVVSKTNLSKDELVFSSKNDIIIPTSGETAIDLATASCVINEGIGIGGDTTIIKTKGDGLFFSYYLNSKRKNIAKLAQGVSVVHLYSTHLKILDLKVPKIEEQEKIASFLSKVDEKIEKLEKKQELWETYKKGMMQKIFSQELRFKDENGENYPDWEEKSMNSFGKFYKGSNLSKNDLIESGFPCILYGDLFTIYEEVIFDVKKFINNIKDNLFLGKKGDLLIPSSTTVDAWSIACSSALMVDNVVLGGDLNVWRPELDTVNSIFISYQINQSVKKDIAKLAQGTTIVHLYNQQLKNVKLKIPNIEEQEKIANLMIFIDFKIKNIMEHVIITKEFKKGLLKQMFC